MIAYLGRKARSGFSWIWKHTFGSNVIPSGVLRLESEAEFVGTHGSYRCLRGNVLAIGEYAVVVVVRKNSIWPIDTVLKLVSFCSVEDRSKAELIIRNERHILSILNRDGALEGVPELLDFGSGSDEFILTPLMDGMSLRKLLTLIQAFRRDDRFIPFCVYLLESLLGILAELHSRGVVHRDLNPNNIFLKRDLILTILDFGFAITRFEGNVYGDDPEIFSGTPHYCAPEQGRIDRPQNSLTESCDLYAVAVTIYELLVGKGFLHDLSIREVMRDKLHLPLSNPTSEAKDIVVPAWLGDLIVALGGINPQARLSSAVVAIGQIEAARRRLGSKICLTQAGAAAFVQEIVHEATGEIPFED